MLITEFGDAFKKIHHLHAHSRRLVPKKKYLLQSFFLSIFIMLSFEILDSNISQ